VCVRPPAPPLQCFSNKHLLHLNLKTEADRRKTYDKWPVPYINKNRLASAGFYYTGWSDIVQCAFCLVEIGSWEEADCPFTDHQRWSPSCAFIKGFYAGTIPIDQPEPTREPTRSNDVCGSSMELRPNSRPEQGKYNNLYSLL